MLKIVTGLALLSAFFLGILANREKDMLKKVEILLRLNGVVLGTILLNVI